MMMKCNTQLNITVDQVQPIMATTPLQVARSPPKDNGPCPVTYTTQEWLEEHDKHLKESHSQLSLGSDSTMEGV